MLVFLLGHSFENPIFLSRSHITSGELVELTQVGSSFLFNIFFNFFVSSFDIRLFSLELCKFFFFFIFTSYLDLISRVMC
jgi:hypothetical protein